MWKPCLGLVSPIRDQHIPETTLATLCHFVQFWKRAGDALVGGGRPRLGRHKRGEEWPESSRKCSTPLTSIALPGLLSQQNMTMFNNDY